MLPAHEAGHSNAEACRVLGINRRTGKRWRNGWHTPNSGKPKPPIHMAASASSGPSRYLRDEDRIHIADRLREKASIRTIATELGRSPSTISREIRPLRRPVAGHPVDLPAPRRTPPRGTAPSPPQAREDRPEHRATRVHPVPPRHAVEP
ncbi:helix-turn-helix domain-containing protein [Streptomyces sp. OE57]|uniref:helix-turn-helix domain-containing protein n=1 Tax=Streptomyces lacaronensis TaxID=3379885 RepID=UPI0039B78669